MPKMHVGDFAEVARTHAVRQVRALLDQAGQALWCAAGR